MSGYLIHSARQLADKIYEYWVEAPRIATKHAAGQFIILRLHDHGERIPLTVVETNPQSGQIRLIVQVAGKTTEEFAQLKTGDFILDLVGPLGQATHIHNWGNLIVIGGGVGSAPLLPIAKAAKAGGNKVHAIIGARSKDLLILTEEFETVCDEVRVCTDDGTFGTKGFVTDVLNSWCETGTRFTYGIAVGPVPMMRAAAKTMGQWGIPGLASLNPIMLDGTGMCGACRVTVNNVTRFACVEGPEFDIHGVDFNELMMRNRSYINEEHEAVEHAHQCQLNEMIKHVRAEA
ncbi:MAG: sulfide/dihydroorotate dehydrogenase-like FAD/NAD-binding protein [bacterium]|nr:sulfide/dihydroorotate dehydrogenase-like FAD/NAD-binding protein [bacterium]